jgi:hypothetical protein
VFVERGGGVRRIVQIAGLLLVAATSAVAQTRLASQAALDAEVSSRTYANLQIAIATTTIGAGGGPAVAASTTALSVRLDSVAVATTTLASQMSAAGASLTAIAVATTTLAAEFVTNSSSMTNTSALGLLVASSVTASAFFGDASHI